jgi:hypothetical protein
LARCAPSVSDLKVVQDSDTVSKTQLWPLVFIKNIYEKLIYVYFYESIFQDKYIHIILTFANSTT